MWPWIIGFGSGLLGTLSLGVLGFLNHRAALSQIGRLNDDYKGAMKLLANVESKNADLIEQISTYEKSTSSLKREVADLYAFQTSQAAELAAQEQANRDLLTAIQASNASGALPVALRLELERLQALVSSGEAGPSTGDSGGREASAVHAEGDVHSSR